MIVQAAGLKSMLIRAVASLGLVSPGAMTLLHLMHPINDGLSQEIQFIRCYGVNFVLPIYDNNNNFFY